MHNLDDVNAAFREVETKLDLFKRKIGGCFYWDYLRYPCYGKVLRHHGVFSTQTEQTSLKRANRRVKQLTNLAHSSLRRNCFSAPQADYVFFGHPRRKLESDGYYWDIYCDPIVEKLSEQYVVLERVYENGPPYHFQPAKTANLRYLDAIQLSTLLRRRFVGASITEEESRELHTLRGHFERQLSIGMPFEEMVTKLLKARNLILDPYIRLLKRIKPRIVFLVVSAGQEHIIEACQALQIPTIELQHGAPSKGKLNYDYEGGARKSYFPDYVFTFGNYWVDHVHWPVEKKNIFAIGFPYLEEKRRKYVSVAKIDQVLVISQTTIGLQLADFVIKLRAIQPPSVSIVFKLHPREVVDWQRRYGGLCDAGIRVIDSNDPDLHLLQSQSKWQIGVYSTALYEGCTFGCRTFLAKLPGVEYMADFVDAGFAKIVEAPEQVRLWDVESLAESSAIFARNWQSNWTNAVADIDAGRRYSCVSRELTTKNRIGQRSES